jgi:hypothetical protein
VTVAGESPLFVDPAEIPGHAGVARLGRALAGCGSGTYELMAQLATYSGLRWGELAALLPSRTIDSSSACCSGSVSPYTSSILSTSFWLTLTWASSILVTLDVEKPTCSAAWAAVSSLPCLAAGHAAAGRVPAAPRSGYEDPPVGFEPAHTALGDVDSGFRQSVRSIVFVRADEPASEITSCYFIDQDRGGTRSLGYVPFLCREE